MAPLHSEFEVRNMVPRTMVGNFQSVARYRTEQEQGVELVNSFCLTELKFSQLKRVYQIRIVSKFHVAPGKFQISAHA